MSTGWNVPTGHAPVCLICGDGTAVRMGLMRYRERADDGTVYSSGWRCIDHGACRDRFERANPSDRYPLEDAA